MSNVLPNKPFATEDFSLPGGGIDFLGLRWVSLTILGQYLVPELNNRTSDIGMFCLGVWIPWKFRQLCTNEKDYTEKNYRQFREKVEVALSLTFKDESEMDRPEGRVRDQVGSAQAANLPCKLTFANAKRKDQNSLYAAAIYGPAIKSLGLISAYHSKPEPGSPAPNIAVPDDNPDAVAIVETVDECLQDAPNYSDLASLEAPVFDWEDIRSLGEAGLDPARYRARKFSRLKEAFARRLLPSSPDDPGYARTLTTHLILETLRQGGELRLWSMRNAWYTGMFPDGKKLRIGQPELVRQLGRWSSFLARQYQRYPIELFLWCFEDALSKGARSIDEVIGHWDRRASKAGKKLKGCFRDILKEVAGDLYSVDEETTSRAWNDTVHEEDERFEEVFEPKDDEAVLHGLRMFAGWYWRMLVRQSNPDTKDLMALGGADRMGMAWFLKWLRDRWDRPIRDLLRDIFSDLIFAQHMRIALSRFDGSAQRLRFLLGDSGIEPSVSAKSDFANLNLPWMPDRLDTLTALLCDCNILEMNDDLLSPGSRLLGKLPGR